MEPLLNQLEAKYGNDIPESELEGLRELTESKVIGLQAQRREIIDREVNCAACDAQLEGDADFCSKCGKRVGFIG